MKRQGSRSLFFSGILTLVPVLGLAVGALGLLRSDQAEVEANAQRELASMSVRLAADVGLRWASLVPSADETLAFHLDSLSRTALSVGSSTWRLNAMGDPVDVFFAPEIPMAPEWWVSLSKDQRDSYRHYVAARSGSGGEQPPQDWPEPARVAAAFERGSANATFAKGTSTVHRANGLRASRIVLPYGMSGNEVALWRGFLSGGREQDKASVVSMVHEYLQREQPGSWSELNAQLVEWERASSVSKGSTVSSSSSVVISNALAELRGLGAFRDLERDRLRHFQRRYPVQYWRDGAMVWDWNGRAICSLLQSVPVSHTNATGMTQGSRWMLTCTPTKVLQDAARGAVEPMTPDIPAYARPRFRWVDAEWNRIAPWTDAGTNSNLSAYRPVRWGNDNQVGVLAEVGFEVFDERLLLAGQRRRALILGGFVIGAACVSALGFWQLRRAFLQQALLTEQQANFVASVSHELRAPVASLGLLVDNLRRGAIAEVDRQQEYLRLMARECRRLSQLIQNVLATGRWDRGGRELVHESLDLGKLVQETVEGFTSLTAENAVKVLLVAAPLDSTSDYEIMGDGLALQQALTNLLENALKHSPVDTVIRIELACMNGQDGDVMRLTIDDSGPGVPEEERERIFDRFYRLGSELRRESAGVGLGLNLVRNIVEAHKGRVWHEPNPTGAGSRFVVQLPALVQR